MTKILLQIALRKLSDILAILLGKVKSGEIKMDNTPIQPIKQSAYKWGTIEEAHHSVRVICDEEGLTLSEKNLIDAVIRAESGYNINAINKNTNGSADHGICQINDGPPTGKKWWIGKGCYFESVDEVVTFPEKSVRFMIQQYKKGNLGYWCAYKNKSYLKYLQK